MRQWWKWSLVVVSLIAVPIIYQNCGVPLDEGNGSSNCVAQDLSTCATAPFAYDVSVDTISYMSISDSTATSTNFFTFRASASNFSLPTGINLRPGFINYISNLGLNDKIKVLQLSDVNFNANYNLAIRKKGYLNDNPYTSSGFFPLSTGNSLMSEQLLTGGVFKSLDGKIIDVDINSIQGEGARVLSTALASGFRLAVGFTRGNSVGSLISAENDGFTRHAYGYGYDLTFGPPLDSVTINTVNYPASAAVITSIIEYNLETGQPTGSSWQCSAARILPLLHTSPNICEGNGLAGANKIISRALGGNWESIGSNSNGQPRCVHHKTAATPFYNTSAWLNNSTPTSCTALTCPHYVSVCTRN